MNYVNIYDTSIEAVVKVVLESDGTIATHNFIGTFPGATGIRYKDNDSNEYFSSVIKKTREPIEKHVFCLSRVPQDVQGNFKCNWDENITYDLIYANRKKRKK
jgi:hypothetical protein